MKIYEIINFSIIASQLLFSSWTKMSIILRSIYQAVHFIQFKNQQKQTMKWLLCSSMKISQPPGWMDYENMWGAWKITNHLEDVTGTRAHKMLSFSMEYNDRNWKLLLWFRFLILNNEYPLLSVSPKCSSHTFQLFPSCTFIAWLKIVNL